MLTDSNKGLVQIRAVDRSNLLKLSTAPGRLNKLSKSPVRDTYDKNKGWINQISSILEEEGNRRASRWCTVTRISFPKAHQPLSGTLKSCSSQASMTQWLWLTAPSSAHSNGLHNHFLKVQKSWRREKNHDKPPFLFPNFVSMLLDSSKNRAI